MRSGKNQTAIYQCPGDIPSVERRVDNHKTYQYRRIQLSNAIGVLSVSVEICPPCSHRWEILRNCKTVGDLMIQPISHDNAAARSAHVQVGRSCGGSADAKCQTAIVVCRIDS
jgi:hypothetical protein